MVPLRNYEVETTTALTPELRQILVSFEVLEVLCHVVLVNGSGYINECSDYGCCRLHLYMEKVTEIVKVEKGIRALKH
jgi:hypothetical protein